MYPWVPQRVPRSSVKSQRTAQKLVHKLLSLLTELRTMKQNQQDQIRFTAETTWPSAHSAVLWNQPSHHSKDNLHLFWVPRLVTHFSKALSFIGQHRYLSYSHLPHISCCVRSPTAQGRVSCLPDFIKEEAILAAASTTDKQWHPAWGSRMRPLQKDPGHQMEVNETRSSWQALTKGRKTWAASLFLGWASALWESCMIKLLSCTMTLQRDFVFGNCWGFLVGCFFFSAHECVQDRGVVH